MFSRLSQSMMSASLPARVGLSGALAAALLVAASAGVNEFATKTPWLNAFVLEAPDMYSARNFMGLLFFITCTTMAVSFVTITLRGLTPLYMHFRKRTAATARRKRLLPFILAQCLLLTLFVVLASVGGTWAHNVWQCGLVGCTADAVGHIPPLSQPLGQGWRSVTGSNAIICGTVFSIVVLAATFVEVRAVLRLSAGNDKQDKGEAAGEPSSLLGVSKRNSTADYHGHFDTVPTHSRLHWRFGAPILFIAFVLFVAFLASVLPNRWMFFNTHHLPLYLGNFALFGPPVFLGDQFVANGEVPDAWFHSTSHKLRDNLYLKLFPSNLFFFGYLLLLCLILLALRVIHRPSSGLSALLSKRLAISGKPLSDEKDLVSRLRKYLATWTAGEVLLSLLTVLMMVLFFMYWVQSHWFNVQKAHGHTERYARSFGQLAVLTVGLLLIPGSRNAVFYKALGVSWEATLWMHRALGTLMLVATFAHAVAWCVRYRQMGLTAADFLFGPMPLTNPISKDNWSTALVIVLCLTLLPLMGVTALPMIRRRFFDVFYHVHLLGAYAMIPAILYHSSASWMYMLPGLTIWFVDRAIRYFRSAAPVDLVGIAVFSDAAAAVSPPPAKSTAADTTSSSAVTELRFRLGRDLQAGQYVFVNVPEVSLLQWHPFTVSSCRNGVATVHIKSMGPGTWTAQLAACATIAAAQHRGRMMVNGDARSHSSGAQSPRGGGGPSTLSASMPLLHANTVYSTRASDVVENGNASSSSGGLVSPPLVVYIDGPYGIGAPLTDYEHIVLVAGGIGITPCSAIVGAIRTLAAKSSSDNNTEKKALLPSVTLAWSVRSIADVAAVGPLFFTHNSEDNAEVLRNTSHENLTIHCGNDVASYIRTNLMPQDGSGGVTIASGRPDVRKILGKLSDDSRRRTIVFVCGPPGMVDSTLSAAVEFGCHFHTETFAL